MKISPGVLTHASLKREIRANPHLIEFFMNSAPGCTWICAWSPEGGQSRRTWLTPWRAHVKSDEKCGLARGRFKELFECRFDNPRRRLTQELAEFSFGQRCRGAFLRTDQRTQGVAQTATIAQGFVA